MASFPYTRIVKFNQASMGYLGDKNKWATWGAIQYASLAVNNRGELGMAYSVGGKNVDGGNFYPTTAVALQDDYGNFSNSILYFLFGDGNTALYDAVCTGMETIKDMRAADQNTGERRLYAVVLLSDGMDSGASKVWRSESAMSSCLPEGEDVQPIPIYTIAYGSKADKDLLTRIANRARGRAFEATPENIITIYQSISAEQ